MPMKNTAETWGSVAKFFHWVTAAAIVAAFGIAFVMEDIEGPVRGTYYLFHKSFGLLALALLVFRLLWRFASPPPKPLPETPRIQVLLAEVIHWALYALMLAVPLAGYLVNSYSGRMMNWFGVEALPVPMLTAVDQEAREMVGEVHETLAWLMLFVLAAHIGAALYHHFIKKDAILARMTPFARQKG